MLSVFRKIKIRIRFLFRQRLKISSDFVDAKVKDYDFSVDINDIERYNDAVKNDTQKTASIKEIIHPVFFTKI